MSARTITITDPADLLPGDLVTLASGPAQVTDRIEGIQHTMPGPTLTLERATGPGYDLVLHDDRDPEPWVLVSATREVPEVEPGTSGTATVELEDVVEHDIAGTWVNEGHRLAYATHQPVDGSNLFRPEVVRNFTPTDPDTAALRAAEGEGKYGSGDLPYGLTVSDDGALINWLGENYVRQGDAPAALPTRDEIADAMHDDHLPDGEPRLGRAYRLILADAVLALLKGGQS